MLISMRTKVQTHEGINIYRVEVRGETFYKTDLVFGEPIIGNNVEEVTKKVDAKRAAGDTRAEIEAHEGVKIFQVKDGSKTYYISEPVVDDVIVGDTAHEVALGITRRHAILGR